MGPTIPSRPGPGGDSAPAALAEWRAAEERLYPIVMTRPDLYERAVQLVRQVADELMVHRDVASLVAAWPEAADVVARAASLALMSLDGLDGGLVAGSAFSLRYRELAVDEARTRRLARIEAAAAQGGGWVEVERMGSPDTAGMVPHSWVEMHVPSGTALRQTIEADPDSGTARFRVEIERRDPTTGERVEAEGGPAVEETFEDREEWVAAVGSRRREIEESAR